jgi:hypothetical protein
MPGRILLHQASAELERSSALPETTSESRERLVRLSYHTADGDFNVTSLQSEVTAYHSLLSYETTWITMLQSCLSD